MGIISVEQVDHLYWLGRYTERVYTTIQIFAKSYDRMIDELEDSYGKYCESLDIPNIYETKKDFLLKYPFDETIADSIISNLNRAYDNAIVLRESIGSDALSYIQLAIYCLKQASDSEAPLIELQQVSDEILSFWGIVDDQIESEQIRNIIKAGKRIERIDLYTRLEAPKANLEREVHRMIPRVLRSGMKYNEAALSRVSSLVGEESIDYGALLESI